MLDSDSVVQLIEMQTGKSTFQGDRTTHTDIDSKKKMKKAKKD